ncbi:MAG: peroxidase, partial [Woeseiaceae bacterium]|nr:peroxidase [Woeseiaceae bacterium]
MKIGVTIALAALVAGCGSGDSASPTVVDTAPPADTGTTAPVAAAPNTSPVLRINRDRNRRGDASRDGERFRTFDGGDNNRLNPQMNEAETQLRRLVPPDYGNLADTLAGDLRPGARLISNTVNAQTDLIANSASASDFLWQWGQFLDHDIDLTDGVSPAERADVAIPQGDAWFDPAGTGTQTFPFNRSIYDPETGTSSVNPRQQLNEITGWIDASNVYGSDIDRATALRTNDGTGRLRTSAGDLLPFNESGLSNAGGPGAEWFVAGDVRANEQLGLTAMHTLFVREHNRLAAEIAARDAGLSGDDVFQHARRIVGAQMQAITYEQFLPVLLGQNALRPYRGYDESIDASIANVFSAAAYRFGHSMLGAQILRLDENGREIAAGHLPLREAFFAPQKLANEGGIEPLLRGLAAQVCQQIDVFVIDDVRNFLFGNPGSGGFDLAMLNIQRGRDHGLPNYNAVR